MGVLPEDPDERAMFDRDVAQQFGGNVLARVAQALTVWAQTAQHPNGSFAKVLAIYANEVSKAANPTQDDER